MRLPVVALASLSFFASSISLSLADDARWPNFLASPSTEVKAADLPLTWSPEKGIAWKTNIPGYGQSSPIVWGDQIYLTSISGPNKEKCLLSAFDLATGKLRWTKSHDAGMPEENTIYVSRAAASPVADADGVIAFYEGGLVVAYTPDGQERWKRDLVADYGPTKVRHGLSSSLAQSEDTVFVWVERAEDPYILALDKKTGDVRWKVPGLGKTAWSSPTLLQIGDDRCLVLSAQTLLVGLNPKTGEQLWKFEGLLGNTTPSPRSLDDGKLLLGASAGRESGGGGNPAQSNALLEVKKDENGAWTTQFIWRADKATCSFNSPLAHQGYAYFVNAQGVLFCLDLADGKQLYAERIGESCWATPIAVDDRIYCFGKGGSYIVIKAGPEFEVLSEGRVWPEGEAETSPDKGSTKLPAEFGAAGGGGNAGRGGENNREGGARPSEQNRPSSGGNAQGRGGASSNPMGDGATLYAAVIVPGKILIRRGGALYCITQ